MRRVLAGFLAFGLIAAPVLPAAKLRRDSAYTNLVGKGCDNPGEGEFICKGLDGWTLSIADEGNIITLRIANAASPNIILELMGRSLSERAEWRGLRTRKGFRSDALIVRMRPVEDDAQASSILYIVKLKPTEACLSGIVDAKANPKPNDLARAAADTLPDMCDPQPRVYGIRSRATDLFSR
jgi:hypothetical protein